MTRMDKPSQDSLKIKTFNIKNIKNLDGGKTTMLYLNLSGHDMFLKKRFGISPEKH